MAALFSTISIQSTLVAIIASLAGIGLLIFGIIQMTRSPDIVNQRMQIYVADRGKTSPLNDSINRILPRELSGTFINRTIKPFFKKIIDLFGKFTPAKSIAKSEYDLRLAGNPSGMHARDYYGLRVIILFLGIGLALFIISLYSSSNSTLLLVSVILIMALYLPRFWLNMKIRRKKDELSHNLPDALDMLSVCATAGLSFDQGLMKICEYWPTALSEEFKQVLQEMNLGIPRTEALRNLKNRVNIDDLSSFLSIIIQAENVGMSIAMILQSQAKQMRILRQFRAKEKANILPAKMMIPVGFFIFPALFAVILGPLIPELLGSFF
jgi:tight adherence protein C